MDRMQLLGVILFALLMSGVGLSLNRRHYPSGLLMAMVGLVVIFFTLGFVVKEFV